MAEQGGLALVMAHISRHLDVLVDSLTHRYTVFNTDMVKSIIILTIVLFLFTIIIRIIICFQNINVAH